MLHSSRIANARSLALFATISVLGTGACDADPKPVAAEPRPESTEPATPDPEPVSTTPPRATDPTPDPIPHPCVVAAAKFDKVFESADLTCTTDADCACAPGGVTENAGCGRVASMAAAKELQAIYQGFRDDGCPLVRHCAPRRCEAKCVEGKCQ